MNTVLERAETFIRRVDAWIISPGGLSPAGVGAIKNFLKETIAPPLPLCAPGVVPDRIPYIGRHNLLSLFNDSKAGMDIGDPSTRWSVAAKYIQYRTDLPWNVCMDLARTFCALEMGRTD